MSSILDTIIAAKKEEVKLLYRQRAAFSGRTEPHRPFAEALYRDEGLSIIAEIKKASPSKGVIATNFDPRAIAEKYYKGGASALSVLTDEKFFMGSTEFLQSARSVAPLPVLRKDFIIDPIQVAQTATMNADAMLLIVAALSKLQLDELYSAGQEAGLDILVEIRNSKELDVALYLSPLPLCIGVNNRDLATFKTDLAATLYLAPHVPKEIALVSESGIESGVQAKQLHKAGVSALLVGESLMRLDDPGSLIKELSVTCQT